MTSSDPTRDPEPEVEGFETDPESSEPAATDAMEDPVAGTDAPGSDLVPHDQGGTVVDPQDTPTGRGKGNHSGSSRPAVSSQTRIGAAWVAVAVGVIVLVLLLIFILQNLAPVTVKYFSAEGTMPLGVLLLFAAAGGALLVIILGFARMLQMRILARRDRKSVR